MNEAELNALVGSRICHDLISPLGAIGNGVELLSMSGVGAAPEIALISESVESASARIRFFRIAYGAANPGDMIGQSELKSVLDDIFRGARLTVDWKVGEDVPRVEAKLAFLLLQCLESAMPWGGKVLVTRSGGAWNVFGSGDRIKVDEDLWGLLIDPNKSVNVTPSHVHFALVHPVTQLIDSRLTANIGESSISLSF
ncbi:MAG: histidine phosphotransferase family protein [Silicimonas sp.]|nr:histidine phosphotransferase family protein [Silicimonas sp.]